MEATTAYNHCSLSREREYFRVSALKRDDKTWVMDKNKSLEGRLEDLLLDAALLMSTSGKFYVESIAHFSGSKRIALINAIEWNRKQDKIPDELIA